jgi:hypothetical protein
MLHASEISMSGYVEVFPAFQSSETKRGIVEFGLVDEQDILHHTVGRRRIFGPSFHSVISES